MTDEYIIDVAVDWDGTLTIHGEVVPDLGALLKRMCEIAGVPEPVHCPPPPSDVFLEPSVAASVECGTNVVQPLSVMEWSPKSANEP